MWSSPQRVDSARQKKDLGTSPGMRTEHCLRRFHVQEEYKARLLSQTGKAYDPDSGRGRAEV